MLNTLLTSAARLCQADHSFIYLREGDAYRLAVGSGDIPEWIEYLKQQTIRLGRGTVAARAVLEGRTVHIPDVLADPEYTFLEAQKRGGRVGRRPTSKSKIHLIKYRANINCENEA